MPVVAAPARAHARTVKRPSCAPSCARFATRAPSTRWSRRGASRPSSSSPTTPTAPRWSANSRRWEAWRDWSAPTSLPSPGFPRGTENLALLVQQTVFDGVEVFLPLAGIVNPAKESARLQKQAAKLEKVIGGLAGRLGSPKFVEKAPEEVVRKSEKEKPNVNVSGSLSKNTITGSQIIPPRGSSR